MSNDSSRQGQQLPPPPPWTPGHSDYPSSQFPAHTTQPPYSYPPPTAGMAAIQQQHMQHPQQDPYRLQQHPHGPYQRPPDMYGAPPQPAAPPVVYQAAAPRQRTAIACRYCRRRKIRCSGFDTSQDGRCSNCVRFNQECMFTPVSSQTQTFVPAHAAYPHLRAAAQNSAQRVGRPDQGVVLYGAHGQPLPPHTAPHGQDQTLPPPPNMYQPYGGHPPQGDERSALPPPLAHQQPQMLQDPVSRKRPHNGAATFASQQRLSPSATSSHSSRSPPQRPPHARRGSGAGYEYSDAPTLPPVSIPTSAPNYQSQSTPTSGSFYPSTPQDRRLSSHSAYSFDQAHGPQPQASNQPLPTLQPSRNPAPIQPTPRDTGKTPPPGQSTGSGRGGLSVRDMLGPTDGQSTRTSTDSDMLNALNRRGLNK